MFPLRRFSAISLFCVLIFQFQDISAIGENVPWTLLRRILPSNPTIIEAGAQFGEDTAWMSQFWPGGAIYAFEPSPESYPALENIAKGRANVSVFQLALSDSRGELPFYLAGGASSLLRPQNSFNEDYFHSDLDHPIMVQTITLDEWMQENGISQVDFMWLDMEGNELNALKGGLKTLEHVKLIYTEVNLQRFWNGCVLHHELKAWLEQQGFEEIWQDIVPHWHGNALFINTNL